MAAALARKQSRRNAIRRELTTNIAECKEAIDDNDCLRAVVLGLKNNLERTITQLNEVDEEILNELDPELIEDDMLESKNILRPTYEIIAGLVLKLEKLTLVDSSTPPTAPSSSTVVNCKLPELELPVFKGQALKWQGFWDQYEVSIHQNDSLSDVNKFNYLKRFLSGEPSACISGLTLSSANYKEAVDVLKRRYGNPQVLITANMETLLKLNKVKGKDFSSLRKLFNEVENCLRSLRSLKVETSTYGSLLLPLSKEKLPEDFILQIGRRFGTDIWTLDNFMDFFEKELVTAENCLPAVKGSESIQKGMFTTSSFFGHVDQARGSQKGLCVFCNREGHASSQCRNVSNVSSRKSILRRSARCFVCLEKGHRFVDCCVDYECRICKQRHNVSICDKRNEKRSNSNHNWRVDKGNKNFGNNRTGESLVAKNNEKDESESTAEVHAHVSTNSSCILLQTATAEISNECGKHIFSRILFDSGSQRSYVKEELASQLNLKIIRKEKVVIKTFGRNDEAELRCLNVVALKVRHKSRRGVTKIVEALCVPTLCSPISNQYLPDSKKFEHLVSLDLADDLTFKGLSVGVDVLIGCDYYHSFFTGRIIQRGNECPTACESMLGWVLSGPVVADSVSNGGSHCLESVVLRCDVSEIDDLKDELKRFWELENITDGDSDVVNSFQRDISFNGDRYVVKLPFKPDHDFNFDVCNKRLKSLNRKLESKKMIVGYGKIFDEYEKANIIEKVPVDEIAKEVGKVHYLPHRPVVREDKVTTKIRAVFDASCESVDGPSLNKCLYSGPNMLSKIFDVLLRFRFNRIAILADIKQAFLNVEIADEHKDFLRFLWYDLESGNEDVVVYRFLRVVFGETSSPFLLNGTIKNHLEKYRDSDKDLVERLIKDFYVDDLVSGCESVKSAKEFVSRVLKIMSDAGFELRKWTTNDIDLRTYFNSINDDGGQITSDCLEKKKCNQVLGMDWDVYDDEFIYDFEKFLVKCDGMKPTKRNILSFAASFYDPLGFISPVTARVKVLFQLFCKNKLGWDVEVSEDLKTAWFEILNVLKGLKSVKLKRFVFTDIVPLRVELHGFCDSSLEVYCAVVYMRIVSIDDVSVKFLCAKTRVAPLKSLTIPRLELLGCLLLTTLLNECKMALQGNVSIDQTFCWSDSEVALFWIKGKEKTWKPWVENRVVKIRKIVDRDSWFHVSGKLNPADGPTRMCKDFNNFFADEWFTGPHFLKEILTENILFDPCDKLTLVDAFAESRTKVTSDKHILDTIVATCASEHVKFTEETETVKQGCSVSSLCDIISIDKFSSLDKLVGTLAYVRRFIHNLQSKVKKNKLLRTGVPSAEEYDQSLSILIRHEQCKLKDQQNYEKIKSSLKLFVDNNGFIRTKGRFGESTLSFQEQCPLMLRPSTESNMTRLLIMDAHSKVFHNGIESTLARMRQRYWFCQGRKCVKSLLRRCVICKRFQGRAMLPPMSPDLPYYRLQFLMTPFASTGLDFAGPLYIRDMTRKNILKVYILLFTCSSSRAVHLELVNDLTSSSFIDAFKRFASRRGYPKIIIHDNAKTFKSTMTKRFFATYSVVSKPILPKAPWWGGMYERLVRSVKLPLQKTVGKALLTFDELNTLLCEIEMTINSRPLVYASEDDLSEPLTPFHLMFGRDITKPLNFDPDTLNITGEDIKNRVQHQENILLNYWKRFSTTYLNELRQFHIYRRQKSKPDNKLYKGDVVLIKDDNPQPRNHWKKGVIDDIVYGRDSQPRGVKLFVVSKTGQRTGLLQTFAEDYPFRDQ